MSASSSTMRMLFFRDDELCTVAIRSARRGGARQPQTKGGAVGGRRRDDLDRAAMCEDDLLRDEQAEPEPARVALLLGRAAERLEQYGEQLRRDGAGVADQRHDLV